MMIPPPPSERRSGSSPTTTRRTVLLEDVLRKAFRLLAEPFSPPEEERNAEVLYAAALHFVSAMLVKDGLLCSLDAVLPDHLCAAMLKRFSFFLRAKDRSLRAETLFFLRAVTDSKTLGGASGPETARKMYANVVQFNLWVRVWWIIFSKRAVSSTSSYIPRCGDN